MIDAVRVVTSACNRMATVWCPIVCGRLRGIYGESRRAPEGQQRRRRRRRRRRQGVWAVRVDSGRRGPGTCRARPPSHPRQHPSPLVSHPRSRTSPPLPLCVEHTPSGGYCGSFLNKLPYHIPGNGRGGRGWTGVSAVAWLVASRLQWQVFRAPYDFTAPAPPPRRPPYAGPRPAPGYPGPHPGAGMPRRRRRRQRPRPPPPD